MPTRKMNLCIAFAICVAFSAGCAGAILATGAAAGAGAYAYTNGELRVVEQVQLDHAWASTQQAAQSLELTPVSESKDGLTARMHAKGSDGKDIYINLRSENEGATQIRIRVGVLGDERLSRRILVEIRKAY